MKLTYLHKEIPELSGDFLEEGTVKIDPEKKYNYSSAMQICLFTLRLAAKLNILLPSQFEGNKLPYSSDSDSLVFKAPLTTALVNKKIIYLRGWKHFDSCVKGFNALGLMAEQISLEIKRMKALSSSGVNKIKLNFLESRETHVGKKIFMPAELKNIEVSELLELDDEDMAIWSCFANRTIYCSTSSNMGISCHQVLRLMQGRKLKFKSKEFTLLNQNEGRLVIWAPDERADFMNKEKTFFLRELEKEEPQITKLRTYINRQQRDPGALSDSLLTGGYFFPTNPQSKDEMQNLIFVALKLIEKERKLPLQKILTDENVKCTFSSIGVSVKDGKVIVERGVESGIFGLMAPYLILLEEFLKNNMGKALSTWNQASIGAALAAATLADSILRNPIELEDSVRSELNSLFPEISKFLDSNKLGCDLKTRIHGVFDLSNLQSLAQLLGVVVENHFSGRGTAYVGLGSSSYSVGNLCFDILKNSMASNGAFIGKDAFHVATHTVNPFAQALIFGEDVFRYLNQFDKTKGLSESIVKEVMHHARKPEPAGATAMAGYLLSRLDTKTLSMVEIAYVLKILGFDKNTFLEFTGYSNNAQGMRSFLQEAYEEGPNMYNFAKNMLLLLDWTDKNLLSRMKTEKKESIVKYVGAPLDDIQFEQLDGPTAIYLTGDNCQQPSYELVEKLANACLGNYEQIEEFLNTYSKLPSKHEKESSTWNSNNKSVFALNK
ncbi:MAG: hypothetical protein A3F80_06160 [Candidatus Melainabacteria bacterium RIFCSPLOWO2_12_FULL_35_11]|nr:MAG: hypothetical protein A3F80_06160 [Candidatus Melainabacteria bacterium RIFCSPLOWO2_12_FULL_35_11]